MSDTGPGADPPAQHDPARDVSGISARLGLADVQLRVVPGRIDRAWVRLKLADGREVRVPMRPGGADGEDPDIWSARIMRGSSASEEIEYSIEAVGCAADTVVRLGPYHVTIDPDICDTPDWAKGAVWYQIFPERFRNGNPRNDPRQPHTFLMPWGAAWGRITPAEVEAAWIRAAAVPGRPVHAGSRGELLYTVASSRRFGGDLQGVVEKLDELADLGVTALYLCPVFQSRSYHKYDATDYRHIDPTLGHPGAPAQDITGHLNHSRETLDPETWVWTDADRYFVGVLLPEAHRRGLRVIIDGVWNHMGTDSWAFRDVKERGAESAYADWFDADFAPKTSKTPGRLLSWRAWDGPNGRMPLFRRTPNGDLAPGPKKHIFDITRRWMDPDGDGDPVDGVDGWRLDVAKDVPIAFWRDWRAHVKSINPEAALIGELWETSPEHLDGSAFDGQMNYPFAFALVDWARSAPVADNGDEPPTPASSEWLQRRLSAAAASLAPAVALTQMNLIGSHDTGRLITRLAHPDRADERDHRTIPATPEQRALAVLVAAVQAMYAGSPMIYNGDELGMHGGNDPDNRKPLPWPDIDREDPTDAADPNLRAEWRRWMSLRYDAELGPVLRCGSVQHLDAGKKGVFAFARQLNEVTVVVVANRSGRAFDASGLLTEHAVAGDDAEAPPRTVRFWVARQTPQ